jgi:hypothetical protein
LVLKGCHYIFIKYLQEENEERLRAEPDRAGGRDEDAKDAVEAVPGAGGGGCWGGGANKGTS